MAQKQQQEKAEHLFLDRVLAIGLHEQRPELDGDILKTLKTRVEIQGKRIYQRLPVVDDQGCKLFESESSLLWGSYDLATFFLCDDLESIAKVAYGSGATSQEFLFGSAYTFDGEQPDFSPIFNNETLPFIAICRLKIGDHWLSTLSGVIRNETARTIYNTGMAAQLKTLVLRCWSWPELIIIFVGKDPARITTVLDKISFLPLKELANYEDDVKQGGVKQELKRVLKEEKAGALLRTWVSGANRKGHGRHPDKVLEDLENCDVIVSLKWQMGILRRPW